MQKLFSFLSHLPGSSQIKEWTKRISDSFIITLLHQSGAFDVDNYLAQNPDVAQANCDPAWHYFFHGAQEGRHYALKTYLDSY